MTSSIRFSGAARTVTGSAYQVSLDGHDVLVDCGVFQGERDAAERNSRPPVDKPADLAAVVLTHGHLDHVGRLPLLVQAGFRGRIHGHPATLAIAEIVLRDSAKIAQYARNSSFGMDDVDEVLRLFDPVPYRVQRTLAGGARLTLFDAGHILGSSSVLLESSSGTILLSGDLGRRNTPILRDPNTVYPDGTQVDAVVIESTYGDRDHPRGPALLERLGQTLRRALDDGGKVLIPAFSIGRTQELVFHLRALHAAGQLDGVPVIVDGPMGLDVTSLYTRYRDCYDDDARALVGAGVDPLSFGDLYGAKGSRQSEAAANIQGPAIIIAGSGMCTGGRILRHLQEFLPDPRTDVVFVGYQARGTVGRRLLEGAHHVALEGRDVPVRARITELSGFSAHADRSGLLTWLTHVPGAHRRVFVCHGEPDAADAFANLARERLQLSASVPHEDDRAPLRA
ncbi:MAG: MBL fold metallo-hydrolase [Polyangiaceae bacterium]